MKILGEFFFYFIFLFLFLFCKFTGEFNLSFTVEVLTHSLIEFYFWRVFLFSFSFSLHPPFLPSLPPSCLALPYPCLCLSFSGQSRPQDAHPSLESFWGEISRWTARVPQWDSAPDAHRLEPLSLPSHTSLLSRWHSRNHLPYKLLVYKLRLNFPNVCITFDCTFMFKHEATDEIVI